MARITVRGTTDRSHPAATIGVVVAGLGLGLAVGFILGELAGPLAARTIRRRGGGTVPRPAVADLVRRAEHALTLDPSLGALELDVVAVRSGAVELHGWVTDRPMRVQVLRRVTEAIHPAAVIDCLRVTGEDDEEWLPVEYAAGPRIA
jgi:hypothetical protein